MAVKNLGFEIKCDLCGHKECQATDSPLSARMAAGYRCLDLRGLILGESDKLKPFYFLPNTNLIICPACVHVISEDSAQQRLEDFLDSLKYGNDAYTRRQKFWDEQEKENAEVKEPEEGTVESEA